MPENKYTVTNLTPQVRDPDRINVFIDGVYKLSLTTRQVIDLGVKVGQVLDEERRKELEERSVFGKVFARTLEWSLSRPRSERELNQYLYKKTLDRTSKRKDGQTYVVKGIPKQVVDEVARAIIEKGYVNNESFARFWVENRMRRKGVSLRRLKAELVQKGIDREIVDAVIDESDRSDESEIQKVINKKRNSYKTEEKLIGYLARQGFSYDDIKKALSSDQEFGDDLY